jgi:ABC-type histidine transport system ATPase subunit
LHKYYDQLHVLKGVGFAYKKGEIVSIVGASEQVKQLFTNPWDKTFSRKE